MNTEQDLNQVAKQYKCTRLPSVGQTPAWGFAIVCKDFKVEILAKRDDGNVLASVKKNSAELEADSNVPRYAEITGQQLGWRFDIIILGAESPLAKLSRKSKEPSEDDLRKALNDVGGMLRAGYLGAPPFTAAWSALEAAMRKKLRAEAHTMASGTPRRGQCSMSSTRMESFPLLHSGNWRISID